MLLIEKKIYHLPTKWAFTKDDLMKVKGENMSKKNQGKRSDYLKIIRFCLKNIKDTTKLAYLSKVSQEMWYQDQNRCLSNQNDSGG